jgi:hypothetical protein
MIDVVEKSPISSPGVDDEGSQAPQISLRIPLKRKRMTSISSATWTIILVPNHTADEPEVELGMEEQNAVAKKF